MTDEALIAWLESGGKVALAPEEEVSRQTSHFSMRFAHAIKQEDLGPTEEMHEAAVARLVYAVHLELNALGEAAYSAVWQTLPASQRAAIKQYIAMAKRQ